MTCDDLPTFSEMNCLLDGVRDALTAPDVIGIVGIVISVALTLAALWLARSANRLAKSSNALAAQAIELNRRAERRRFGDAVLGYYHGRKEDLWNGANWNMPHYTHKVIGVAKEVDEPQAVVLLQWLTDTIDSVLDANSYDVDGDINRWNFLRQADAHRLEMTVPIEIGRWVHDPEGYIPDRFIIEKRMQVSVRQSTDSAAS